MKKRINNKGFMITELLVVTVAIMAIFTIIYSNFFPTLGEYEKREQYNNISSTYASFYLRVFYLENFFEYSSSKVEDLLISKVDSNGYQTLVSNGSCTNFVTEEEKESLSIDKVIDFTKCNDLVSNLGIKEAIITKYQTSNLKNVYSGNLKEYINYLPNYKEDGSYRIIIKTNDGYATSSFYSKKCEQTTLTDWDDWTLTPCDTEDNNCESSKAYLKLGDWTTMICDTSNSLCEQTILYRPNSNLTTTKCDSNVEGCEEVNGYLVQTRTQTGVATCDTQTCETKERKCATYEKKTVYVCSDTENSSEYDSEAACNLNCNSACNSKEVNSDTCSSYKDCEEGYTFDGTICKKCYTEDCPVYSSWSVGTYEETCVPTTLTKCTPTKLYRIISNSWKTSCIEGYTCESQTGYRTNEICENKDESCCTDTEICEEKVVYRTRSSLVNDLDLNSPYVSKCN